LTKKKKDGENTPIHKEVKEKRCGKSPKKKKKKGSTSGVTKWGDCNKVKNK